MPVAHFPTACTVHAGGQSLSVDVSKNLLHAKINASCGQNSLQYRNTNKRHTLPATQ